MVVVLTLLIHAAAAVIHRGTVPRTVPPLLRSVDAAAATLRDSTRLSEERKDVAVGPVTSDSVAPLRPRTSSEFELNRGRVIDTLRHDYPLLFSQPPDLELFLAGVTLSDPSGQVRVRGVGQYSRLFGMLRFLRRAAMQDAQLTYRMAVDETGSAVRPPGSLLEWQPP